MRKTLARYYAERRKNYAEDYPDFYDADLRAIFGGEPSDESAARFLRTARKTIVPSIVRWTGEHKYTVDQLVRRLMLRCERLALVAPQNQSRLNAGSVGLPRGAGDQPPAHRPLQEVGVKILILFDLHRAPKPDEDFSARRAAPRRRTSRPRPTCSSACAGSGTRSTRWRCSTTSSPSSTRSRRFAPDVVFNLTESFHAQRSHEPNIPALLELLKVRYTGAGPDALLLCKDKSLAKKLLAYHRVRVARFVVSPRASAAQAPPALRLPGVRQAGRRGVVRRDRAGVVRARRGRGARARQVHPRALRRRRADRGVHRGARALRQRAGPPAARGIPAARAVLREAARRRAEVRHLEGQVGRRLPKEVGHQERRRPPRCPSRWSRGSSRWRAPSIACSRSAGSGRIDVRLTPAGEAIVIEANPNPSLAREDDFAQSAATAGTDYDTLIQKILDAATV